MRNGRALLAALALVALSGGVSTAGDYPIILRCTAENYETTVLIADQDYESLIEIGGHARWSGNFCPVGSCAMAQGGFVYASDDGRTRETFSVTLETGAFHHDWIGARDGDVGDVNGSCVRVEDPVHQG
ncbi:MAG: hypothetical protein ABUS57_06955 [Pseudomonadota bacterium]